MDADKSVISEYIKSEIDIIEKESQKKDNFKYNLSYQSLILIRERKDDES